MSRPLRIAFAGAHYHITNRGQDRRVIFQDKEDRNSFLNVLQKACEYFNVDVYAYCLMGNHYHLLIHTPQANLSRFMRHVDGVYTQRYNRKYKKDGPLFRGRYKAKVVQDGQYLFLILRYIHLNPVKAKMTSTPDYPWSSHQFYLKAQDQKPWLSVSAVLKKMHTQPTKARELYKDLLKEGIKASLEKEYNENSRRSILGEQHFIDRIKEQYIHTKRFDPEIERLRFLRGQKIMAFIDKNILESFGSETTELLESRQGLTNLARQTALVLAREYSGLTLKEIACHYQIKSYKSVESSVRRFYDKLKYNGRLKNIRDIHARLSQRCRDAEI